MRSMVHAEAADQTVVSLGAWRPTPEGFAAYRDREIALCRALRRQHPTLPHGASLFSLDTWGAAGRS